MADQEWIRNLANATLHGKEWRLSDPRAADRIAEARLKECMSDLYAEAEDSCAIYNQNVAEGRQIQLLRVNPVRGSESDGFMLLLEGSQVHAKLSGFELQILVSAKVGYQLKNIALRRFSVERDPFGDIRWRLNKQDLYSYPAIVKLMLEDLCRAAFEMKGSHK